MFVVVDTARSRLRLFILRGTRLQVWFWVEGGKKGKEGFCGGWGAVLIEDPVARFGHKGRKAAGCWLLAGTAL